MGECECLKTINIKLGKSSTLTFLPVTIADGDNLCLKGFANISVWISLAFPWKQTWFQAIQQCRCFVFVLSVSLHVCSLCSDGLQPPTLTDSSANVALL